MADREFSEMVAESIIEPINNVVDLALQLDDSLVEKLEDTLREMINNQSQAQAISGMLLDMDDVDLRQVQLATFKDMVKYIKQRQFQRDETIRIKSKKRASSANLASLRSAMGF